MKILRIDIESLASLRDRQPPIALDAPPLNDAGLIAIVGATGAGKSTILDAVALALYGRTPRLSGRSVDELMTRGTGVCSAAVELRLDDGREWRAEWSLRRARGKADGRFQNPEHRLLDRSTGEILAEKKRDVDALVAEGLGLTFDQFTRVVLLAQGEFARFLRADATERSELLEYLTGTEIYSRLSRAAFERHKAWRTRREEARGRLDVLEVLAPEERTSLESREAQLAEEIAAVDRTVQAFETRQIWLDTQRRLIEATARADRAVEERARHLETLEPSRRRLQAAEQAIEFDRPIA
ncbi:MAG: AAA family ATPase, partial [Acidobacteriota bacterium]